MTFAFLAFALSVGFRTLVVGIAETCGECQSEGHGPQRVGLILILSVGSGPGKVKGMLASSPAE